MSLILEAFILGGCGAEQIITAAAGLAKMSDLVSDIFFIITLSDFNSIFRDAQNEAIAEDKVPIKWIMASAIFFTIVGVAFEAITIYLFLKKFLKERRERLERQDQDDDNQEPEEEVMRVTDRAYLFLKKKLGRGKPNDKEVGGEVEKEREKRPFPLNLFLEEIPQFIILIIFIYYYSTHTEAESEYIDELIVAGFTSFVFTVGTVCFTLFRMCRGRMRWRPDCRKINSGNDNGLHAEDATDAEIPTSLMSSSNTDEDCLRVDNRVDVERTVHPDGFETIRTATFPVLTDRAPSNGNDVDAEDNTDAVIPTSHMSSSIIDEYTYFLHGGNRVVVKRTVYPDGSETIRNETFHPDGS
jgi:predicted membrane protein